MNNITKIDRQAFIQTALPEETMGVCIHKKCNNYTFLGNGYCMKCWDKGRGLDEKDPQIRELKMRKSSW